MRRVSDPLAATRSRLALTDKSLNGFAITTTSAGGGVSPAVGLGLGHHWQGAFGPHGLPCFRGGAISAANFRSVRNPRRFRRLPPRPCPARGRNRGRAAARRSAPTSRPPMLTKSGQMRQMTTAKLRLDVGKAERFNALTQSTGGFDCLLRSRSAIYRCPRRPKARSWAPTTPESGECRIKLPLSDREMPVQSNAVRAPRE
jgi:hypothetical protein